MSESKTHHTLTRDMLGRDPLISVAEGQNRLFEALQGAALSIETIPLEEALDRITAEDIFSPLDLPASPRSTMDGFAVIASDTFGASESMPCYLKIAGEILMGENPIEQIVRGSCYKIATGGLLPPGSDAVVMFEHTIPIDDTLIEIVKSTGQGSNIIDKGDDIEKDSLALPKGHFLRPQDLGLLAGLGITTVHVRRRLKIGVLSTGDEIVDFRTSPQPGQIRNINSIALSSQAKRMGAEVTDYGIVLDRRETFFPAIKQAMNENDLVIFSGGSSVGSKDLGEEAVSSLGSPGLLVHGVALKPGKPILIGLHGTKPLFGLPGHPVSALVCFDFFVKPAINILSGISSAAHIQQGTVKAILGRNVHSAPGRRDVIRVRLENHDNNQVAHPVLGKSGSISTLSRAHGYIVVEEPIQGLHQDTMVEVYLFQ